MDGLPVDIGDVLAVAEAASGVSGGLSASDLFEACELSLLFLADDHGAVFFEDRLESEFSTGVTCDLAKALAEQLVGRQACLLDFPTVNGPRIAIGTRLPHGREQAIAGCLVNRDALVSRDADPIQAAQILCAAFALSASGRLQQQADLRTRVDHMRAERETLKLSHARAIAAVIEEREKRLHLQRQDMVRLEAVMKLAADGIVTINDEGVIDSFNQAAGRIFGYDPDEVVGQHVSLLTPQSESHPELLALCLGAEGAAVPGPACEVMGKRKDGTLFPLEIAVSEVELDWGRVRTGIFRDIADRRQLEGQLVQAQKMESVGQLAAGIAHEINTPTQYVGDNTRFLEDVFQDLSPLLGKCKQLCEVAGEGGQVPDQLIADIMTVCEEADLDYLLDEIPRAIGQSLEGVERVATIVRCMKEFSHPGGDVKQAVDLNRALESTLTVCRNEWKYVADAVTEFDPNLPLVHCLPGECNQVFLNLLVNAAHAIGDTLPENSTDKGTISVSTRLQGDWVEVRISDTGTGIPKETVSKIFDPFFTTKAVGRGTGQGLAIAHSVITEKHAGRIDVDTEVGRGTTFIIRLPINGTVESTKGEDSAQADPVC